MITVLRNRILTDPIERTQYGLIAAWALAMIALPILKWTFGTDIIPLAVTMALFVQFSAVSWILGASIGWRATGITFVIVAICTWALEYSGSTWGFPFGSYDYTAVLQPQIGHVPLLIPLAWFMMLPSAWAIAALLTDNRLTYIGLSALAITAWDLFLDPQMVTWGFWIWENPSGYFGIPWSNYAGWLLTGAAATILARPWRYRLPTLPLLVIYGIIWFLQSIGLAVFWGQPGPALVGSLAMGFFLAAGIRRYLQTQAIMQSTEGS